MLQLADEQVQRLQEIKLERDRRRLVAALSAAFPEPAGRLGENFGPLVTRGQQQAAGHGLRHGACVARYLACWLVLGVGFEAKPGGEWALALLGDGRRSEGAKAFLLTRRTREALARLHKQPTPPPGLPDAAGFDAALESLDGALQDGGTLGSLWPGGRIPLGDPCDIDAVELRLVDAGWRQHYVVEQQQWKRQPWEPPKPAVVLAADAAALPAEGVPPPALPAQLTLIAQPAGETPAKLRVRTKADTRCDAAVHPLITLTTALDVREWRGPQAAQVQLAVNAEPTLPPPEAKFLPVIALEGSPRLETLALTSCALREAGPPLGELSTMLAAYPAEQHLIVWKREEGKALEGDTLAATTAAPPATVRCRIERDGEPLDAGRWQAGLQALDRQFAEGLQKLLTAWERESGVSAPHLACEPSLMAGQAGITWGWQEGPQGIAAAPTMRFEGLFNLIAFKLGLRLSGQLAVGGSTSQLSLHNDPQVPLQCQFSRSGAAPDLAAALQPAMVEFKQPFTLQLSAFASAELALLEIAAPPSGELVGSAGLRLRTEGPGLQWFAKLAVEPVSAEFTLHDPLLGRQRLKRPLLPALTLLDWSLG